MTNSHFQLIYDIDIINQIKAIERKYHPLIRKVIEDQLKFEPDVETRNRKPMVRTTVFGARWELRFGKGNQFQVFYSV